MPAGILVVGTLMIDVVTPWVDDLEPGANYIVELESCYGGGGGNVAYHLARAGARVGLASALGSDPLGVAYEERLRGLGARLYLAWGPRTGMLVALRHRMGERTFLVDPGANTLIDRGLVEEALRSYRPRVTVIHGYLLPSPKPREAAIAASRLTRAMGSTVVFDPGYFNMAPQELEAALEITANSDIIVPNEAEAITLAGIGDPVEAARALARRYGVTVYLKRGARGSTLIDGSQEKSIDAPQVEVVSTVGSGDAYTAIVALGAAECWPPGEIAERATHTASMVTRCRCPQCTG